MSNGYHFQLRAEYKINSVFLFLISVPMNNLVNKVTRCVINPIIIIIILECSTYMQHMHGHIRISNEVPILAGSNGNLCFMQVSQHVLSAEKHL